MSDFEDFGDKDPAAEFIARQNNQLAELEVGDHFGVFEAPDTSEDAFEEIKAPVNMFPAEFHDDIDLNEFDEITMPEEEKQDLYAAVQQADKQRQESEKILKWREEQKIRLEKKDAESELKKAQWRDTAHKEIDDWYKHMEEQLTKTKANNRSSEEVFVSERDEKTPGNEWERITRLCEFNAKAARNTKDISRMRSILLQLKQTPPLGRA